MEKPKHLTPMMRNWWEIKAQYQRKFPDSVIAYRMGDFYEYFYDDAKVVSKLAGITLTKRGKGTRAYALAGVPHHAAKIHFRKLLRQNQTIVVVEQLEDPKKATGPIVKRGVVGVLSPGMIWDEEMLDARKNNFLMALVREVKKGQVGYGAAFIDLSCGEFWTWQARAKQYDNGRDEGFSQVMALVAKYEPAECILPPELYHDQQLVTRLDDQVPLTFKQVEDFTFALTEARESLKGQFHLHTLETLELEDKPLATAAAGALVRFLEESQANPLSDTPPLVHLKPARLIKPSETMVLDVVSQNNLEILKNLRDGTTRGTLLEVFDHAITPMGSRLLRKWLIEPLLDVAAIEARQNVVAHFKRDVIAREDFRAATRDVGDVERLISLINHASRCNARHLLSLKASLEKLPQIKNVLARGAAPELAQYVEALPDFSDLVDFLDRAVHPDPPTTVTEGQVIADGYDAQVDEYRDVLQNGKQWIVDYGERLKELTPKSSGIKVGYNKVFGYYVEITKKTLPTIAELPPEFEIKQTLANSQRYATPELKEIEVKILTAEEKSNDLEHALFDEIRQHVAEYTGPIQAMAERVAELDVLVTFAEVASLNDYCRPAVSAGHDIDITAGRHPVVEVLQRDEPFVPNDTHVDPATDQILLITGPNMAGKSTYLRQVALITLMAQVGSFVPARSARVGVVDRIFTRVGASDNLTNRQSTFMVEMVETAIILNNATRRSLVVIDELGRGTSTSDGFSIAHAVLDFLHQRGVKTLFSTHFHQLTELAYPRLKNYHLAIQERDGELIFLRKLVAGGTDKSYGIHVAALAGLPGSVITKARAVMAQVEREDPYREYCNGNGGAEGGPEATGTPSEPGKADEKTTTPGASPSSTTEAPGGASGNPPSGGSAPGLARFGIPVPPRRDHASKRSHVKQILRDLLHLPVEDITPLEAMQTLARWQADLRALKQRKRDRGTNHEAQ